MKQRKYFSQSVLFNILPKKREIFSYYFVKEDEEKRIKFWHESQD